MNQQTYAQFLLTRSLEDLIASRYHPTEFSQVMCIAFGINEKQRLEALLTAISIKEKNREQI